MNFRTLPALTQWVQNAPRLWLFLDYDGTLAEFTPTPYDIRPQPRVIAIIERLMFKPNVRVTLLSGRSLPDIFHLVPVPGIFWAGTYGIEMLTPTGERIDRVEYKNIRPRLDAIKPQWEAIIQGRSAFFLEDKGWSLALHARFAQDLEANQVIERAAAVASQAATLDQLKIVRGHKFLEVAPSLANKKETVDYLIDRYPFPAARYLYIGDDEWDEEAFSAIHAHGGAAIRIIRPDQPIPSTAADYRFDSPNSLLSWLEQLL